MHGVEELAEAPYLFGSDVIYELVLAGVRHRVTVRGHAFAGWRQCYFRVVEILDGDQLRRGKVLHAEVQLLEARALWARGEVALQADPYAFVERESS